MASTRNKNTPGNYCLQQRNYNLSNNYTLYPNSQYGYANYLKIQTILNPFYLGLILLI